MQGELSLKSKLIRSIVSEFNSNKKFTERYSVEEENKSEIDVDFKYPDHL